MAQNFAPNHSASLTIPWCAIIACLGISVLFSAQIHAAEDDSEAEDTISPPRISFLTPLDKHRDAASQSVVKFANWVDNFFGDDRAFDESQKSFLKVNFLQINEEGYQPRFEANLQGKLTLPNTQKRLKLLILSEPEDGASDDNTAVEAIEAQEQTIGLRYIQYTSDWLTANTDAGVRLNSGLDAFVRFRVRGLYNLGSWNLRAAQTLFWRDSSGTGETTQLDFERSLATRTLFRSTSKATYRDETRLFDMSQNFYLIHTINQNRAVIYRTGVTGESEPYNRTTDYVISVQLRERIHSNWLFLEINPKVNYPREEGFQAIRSLTFKLEAIFGGL